jgi:transcriptional regulator
MYIPPAFNVDCPEQAVEFMQQHSFATLVTVDGEQAPFASHLPVLCEKRNDGIVLLSHMARANPQWKQFDCDGDGDVLTIFNGPHAYVSPSWYNTVAVPTWNYAAVHVYGTPRLITEDDQLEELLLKTVTKFEQRFENPWTDQNEQELRGQLKKAIVGFEIHVTRVEAKFKLSQNRSAEDVQGAYNALSVSPNQTDRDLAELMRIQ